MINVKYPRRGFVVEEVIEACKTEGCTAKKFVVNSWEHYGEDTFNDLTEGCKRGEHSEGDHTEGICPKCRKPVIYKDYFVVTSDASTIKTAEDALNYAVDFLNAPFPEGETLIATNAHWSYNYAKVILKAPFSLGEPAIAKDAIYSYKYAKDILKAPFLLGESLIATDAEYSYKYAKHILKAPFLLGEKTIATDAYYYKEYKKLFSEPQATPEPQAPTIEEPQAPDSMNIVSGFYLAPAPQVVSIEEPQVVSTRPVRLPRPVPLPASSISDKKQKDVIKSTFLTLVYTLEEIIEYDQENDKYFWVGSLFDADRILQSINDLMETFPELTEDLALQEYDALKSYMDEYSKYCKEKHEKEKPRV